MSKEIGVNRDRMHVGIFYMALGIFLAVLVLSMHHLDKVFLQNKTIVFSDHVLPIIAFGVSVLAIASVIVHEWNRAMRAEQKNIMMQGVIRSANQKIEIFKTYLDATRELASDSLLSIDGEETIIFCNMAAEKLFGWPNGSLVGQKLDVVLPHRYRADHHRHVHEFSKRDGGPIPMGKARKIFALRRDGSEVAVQASIFKIVVDESLIMMVSMRDVSRLLEAETELKNAAGLAISSIEAKSQFLANVSHELRTPLNAILGFSDLLASEVAGPLNDRQKSYLNDVLNAGHLLLNVLNDILAYAKISAGQMDFQDDEHFIPDLVRQCAEIMMGNAIRKSIQIHQRCSDNLPELVCDARAVKQILLNLMSNAIKFSRDHDKILVTCQVVDEQIEIEVQDHGIGIASDDLPKILEPFRQASHFSTRHHEGTGLGLSIVNALVAAHGARLSIKSTPGEGTSVKVTFPKERTVSSVRKPETGKFLQTAKDHRAP